MFNYLHMPHIDVSFTQFMSLVQDIFQTKPLHAFTWVIILKISISNVSNIQKVGSLPPLSPQPMHNEYNNFI